MVDKKFSRNLTQKYLLVASVVAAYWIISISIVFINKSLFTSQVFNIKAPIFVTWTQSVTTVLICFAWQYLSVLFPRTVKFPASKPFAFSTVKSVLPLSVLYIVTIGSGNLSLSFVEVSFYFISRSLTTVFNVIFTYLILNVKTSSKSILCCTVIIFGFCLGVDQENFVGTLSLKGTALGVTSSVSLSLYSIYIKKVLPLVGGEAILISFYNNIYSSFLFLPLIYLNNEWEELKNFDFANLSFWVLTEISGVFAFLIAFVTALQIKVTSPLTHNISGTAKACAQTVIATYWFEETKSVLWWFSNFLVLAGSAVYARVRQLEMAQKS